VNEELPSAVKKDAVSKLYAAVLADVMDHMGIWDHTMRYDIRPLEAKMRVFGPARTVLAVEVYKVPEEPYKLEIQAVDSLKPGDVMVVTQNGATCCSFWGELLSNAAVGRGANGIVIDGFTRDVQGILESGFPVFCRGTSPADSRGRLDVIDVDVPIKCGDVMVNPGDYIFGDADGVVVIPKDALEEVLRKAIEKVEQESTMREELRSGMSVAEAFHKHGIL